MPELKQTATYVQTTPSEPTPLRCFLADLMEGDDAAAMLGTIRVYVLRFGVAEGAAAREAALEIFNQMVVVALEHEQRFDPTRSPKAWLLGIATNLIKQRRDALIKQRRREPLVRDMYSNVPELSEAEMFNLLACCTVAGPEERIVATQQVDVMLALINADDREVIELAVLHGMNTIELARALRVTSGAARVRLHRALKRLQDAWTEYCRQQEGANHE